MTMEGMWVARVAAATVLWTTAVALGIGGSVYLDMRLLFWAVLVALVACLSTNHLLTECVIRQERVSLESLVDGLVAAASERATVKAEQGMDHIH